MTPQFHVELGKIFFEIPGLPEDGGVIPFGHKNPGGFSIPIGNEFNEFSNIK